MNSTPTIIVDGEKFDGGLTIAQMRAVIDPMIEKRKKTAK